MITITLAAPAKINLSLRILGKRPDGFHGIESMMVPLLLADTLEITHGSAAGIQLTCSDPEIPTGEDNLCVRAAALFLKATGLNHGIAITLQKRIPHGAGLGGGSSDAAAVLKGLNALFDHPLVEEELHELATQLGSDVPFFLLDGPAMCRGRGEILEPVPQLPDRTLLLMKPPFPVPTVWAYKQYSLIQEEMVNQEESPPQQLGALPIFNDLERPVFEKHLLLPVIKSWLLQRLGVESAFMTGSGSTMVAIMTPEASPEMVEGLKMAVAKEFGASIWMCCTKWAPEKPDANDVP